MSEDLKTLTKELGEVYNSFKDFEKKLAGVKGKNPAPGLKQRFFHEATEAQTTTLAQKTASVVARDYDHALAKVKKLNPRWRVLEDATAHDDGSTFVFLLEENPEFKPFVYINRETERVWTKQVVDGSPWIDDNELRHEDHDLWNEVSEIPNRATIESVLYECNVDLEEISDKLESLWDAYDGVRVMKELDELTPEQLIRVQEYIYPGAPTVKLSAPRKAKPEELSDEGS